MLLTVLPLSYRVFIPVDAYTQTGDMHMPRQAIESVLGEQETYLLGSIDYLCCSTTEVAPVPQPTCAVGGRDGAVEI